MLRIILAVFAFYQTSIYSLTFTTADGQTVSLSSYQGKKILIVNIATGSPKVSQLSALQQLKQQYGDSLVVIAFPSNSFANETRSDSAIKAFCVSNYGSNFIIASKGGVAGNSVQPIYSWLTTQAQNGVSSVPISSDFQKYLIDKEGNLVGIFSSMISPTDPKIISSINQN